MRSIVIPVKTMPESKLRLSGAFSNRGRRELSLAMLEDVLDVAVKQAPVSVVTSDPSARKAAALRDCSVIEDPGLGLAAAIDAATGAAMLAGSSTLLVLPCDVPLIEGEELATLLNVSSKIALVASPDGGTNALLRTPPDVIATYFGPDSAASHIAAARIAGVAPAILDLRSIAFDVDTPEDLILLSRSERACRGAEVARRLVSRGAEVRAPSQS